MLSVTKYRFKLYWYKHVTVDARPLYGHLLPSGSSGISSAAFVFDYDLATELETYAKAKVKLFSKYGLLHW